MPARRPDNVTSWQALIYTLISAAAMSRRPSAVAAAARHSPSHIQGAGPSL